MIQLDKMSPAPPHTGDHTACSRPNPPSWCDEVPQDMISDQYVGVLLLIALLIGIVYLSMKEKE